MSWLRDFLLGGGGGGGRGNILGFRVKGLGVNKFWVDSVQKDFLLRLCPIFGQPAVHTKLLVGGPFAAWAEV